MIYNYLDLIGNTPIIKFDRFYIKLEYFNPSGSIKDRMSLRMIKALEQSGKLKLGDTIIEATSGNTGISVSMIAALRNYKCVIVMKDNVTLERINKIKAYGAKVILVDSKVEHIEFVAEELAKRLGLVFLNQYQNENNYLGYEGMANEIIKNFRSLDYLVTGIGTGGTIYGLAKVLKKTYPNLKVIGVLPKDLDNNYIYGIGTKIEDVKFDMKLVDEIIYVDNKDAICTKNKYSHQGLLLGNSTGAYLYVANNLPENKKILIISPDNGDKYLSVDDEKIL